MEEWKISIIVEKFIIVNGNIRNKGKIRTLKKIQWNYYVSMGYKWNKN